MKKKNLFLLSLLIVLAVLAWLSVQKPWQKKESSLLFPGISPSQVTKVEIKSSQGKTVLEKKNEAWVISSLDNLPANQKRVESLLDKIKQVKKINLASAQEEKASFYEVDKEKGKEVKVWEGEKLSAHFIVGKNGPSFVGSYLKKVGSSNIYLADEVLGTYLDLDDFKDKKILGVSQDKITALVWEYPKKKFQLTKDGEDWYLGEKSKGRKADPDKVNGVTSLFANFSAQDVFTSSSQQDLDWDNPDLTFTLKEGEKETSLKFIKKDNQYFTLLPEKGLVYKLYEYQEKKLFKKENDFR